MINFETVAQVYSTAKHNPMDLEVIAAYAQFRREIEIQFETLPVDVEFTGEDPYKTSKEMFSDIVDNNRLKIFSGGKPHELMADVNLKFRAIHDYYGHFVNRNSFSGNGEYKAYVQHSKMFSKLAVKALFTETVAQNAVYNVTKEFAEQKACILEFVS